MEFHCIACDSRCIMSYPGQRLCASCVQWDIDAAERARKPEATVAWTFYTTPLRKTSW